MSKQICIFTIRGVPFKSNMYFIFRWGTTRKRPSWSKRWTPRRGCSWCTGRTRAGSSNWRRTPTSRRSLKRLHNFLLLSVIWEEHLMIYMVNHNFYLPFLRLGLIRRRQAALDWPVQVVSTNLLSCVLVRVLQISGKHQRWQELKTHLLCVSQTTINPLPPKSIKNTSMSHTVVPF